MPLPTDVLQGNDDRRDENLIAIDFDELDASECHKNDVKPGLEAAAPASDADREIWLARSDPVAGRVGLAVGVSVPLWVSVRV
jgi:hypothetical protein